jgi:O-antigen ligase
VDTPEKFDKFLFYWFITFVFLSFGGIKNRGVGIGGFFGDENDFCMALNMVLPFSIFSMFMDKDKKQKFYYILITCLYLFVIVLTKSRGGFVGLVAVIGYSILRSNKKALLTVLIGVFGIFIVAVAPQGYWQEMGTISDEASKKSEYLEEQSGTGAQRLYSWNLGWHMFLENPIVGIGQGNYPWHVKDQEERLKLQWKERSLGGRAAHSLYFTLLPELGIVGVTIFVFMLIYTWKDLNWLKDNSHKNKKLLTAEDKKIYYTALAMEASIIGYLTSSVFISTLYYPNLWLMIGFVVAFKNIISNSHQPLTVSVK